VTKKKKIQNLLNEENMRLITGSINF